MAKIEYNKSGSRRSVGTTRPSMNSQKTRSFPSMQKISNAQKVEELKLGKFSQCEPMRLPEKEVKRCWQIVGGVALFALAALGIFFLLTRAPFSELIHPNGVTPVYEAFITMEPYWAVMILAAVVLVIVSVIAGGFLLFKRRVPILLWYLLVSAIVVGVICASFHQFRLYELRECYNKYPNIVELGYACPSVTGELSMIVLKDLGIFAIGIIAVCWLRNLSKRRTVRSSKRKS